MEEIIDWLEELEEKKPELKRMIEEIKKNISANGFNERKFYSNLLARIESVKVNSVKKIFSSNESSEG